MVQKFFTAGFYEEECNFSVENIPNEKSKDDVLSSIYLVEKMLLRGLPTKPSTYLMEQMRKHFPDHKENKSKSPTFIDNSIPIWDKTILGNEKNPDNNPAREFFKNILPKHLGEYGFVTKLMKPECLFNDFLMWTEVDEKINLDYRADFFIDIIDCVIEIDGAQHKNETQKSHDIERDKALALRGIKTFRFPTDTLKTKGKVFKENLEEFKKMLKQSPRVNEYKEAFKNKRSQTEHYENTLTAIMRLQISLIELIKQNILNPKAKNWNLDITSDVVSKFNWVQLACEDLYKWLVPISALDGVTLIMPKFNISVNGKGEPSSENSAIKIDLKLFQRWDEENETTVVKIRSDYVHKTRPYFKNEKLESLSEDLKICLKDHANIRTFKSRNTARPYLPMKVQEKALLEINMQLFGFKNFKDGQLEIIRNILIGGKTLGLLPTGGGKSLCYHLSSSLNLGCSIVICPIIALMKDQVLELTEMGFGGRVRAITSDTSPQEKELIKRLLQSKKLQFAFISPERFQTKEFRNIVSGLYSRKLIESVVIDEVHCLSEWGHSFRLSYLILMPTIKRILPHTPITCLTATASLSVIRDIQVEVGIDDDEIIYKMENSREELSFQIINPSKRDNLNIDVKELEGDKEQALFKLMDELKSKNIPSKVGSGLIYTPHVIGRKGCFTLYKNLMARFPGIKLGFFSGSPPVGWDPPNPMPKQIKKKNPNIGNVSKEKKFNAIKESYQEAFKENELHLLCATKSFGMGINKPNVRFTCHFGMPSSMEALYQEAGRAGRDGKEADCYVLFNKEPDGIPAKLHRQDLPIAELKKSTEGYKADFKTQLALVNKDLLETEKETALIVKLYQYLKDKGVTECTVTDINMVGPEVNASVASENIQNAIYRLYQLGIVWDWEVVDFFKKIFVVRWNKKNDLEISKNLISQLLRYDKTNSKQIKADINKIMLAKDKEGVFSKLIKYLLEWNYTTFTYNRRQSLKTLYEACENFEKSGKRNFKAALDSYFTIDTLTLDLESLVNSSGIETITQVVKFLTSTDNTKDKKLKPIGKIERMQYSIARYLESYRDNKGLNLLSGLCRLLTGTFNDSDGSARLLMYLKFAEIKTEDWNNCFRALLNFVKLLPQEKIDLFADTIMPHLSNSLDLAIMHEVLDHSGSGVAYIETVNTRLEAIFR